MKKFILLLLLVLIFIFLLNSICFADVVNGDTLSIDGKKVLKIWGTHYERGYAYGYLMGEEIIELFENYFLLIIFLNNPTLYVTARNYFEDNFEIELKYHTEVIGMINGIIDNGYSIYNPILNRDLDEIDILFCNSILEILALYSIDNTLYGCSSLSSWGESTIADPILNGETVITRHLDWYPYQTLLENHLLIVNIPSEANEQNWVSFTFPGMIGALSAINQSGVASFLNMGNNSNHPNPGMFHPIFLTIRNGIEHDDYNGDYECNPMDIADAILDKNRLSDNIIHVVSSVEKNYNAIIIECNNENGVAIRDTSDNTIVPGENLVATNHFRVLYPPVYCNRYENIVDSLNNNINISSERSWRLLCGAAGTFVNLQTIQFIPMSGTIKWATAKNGSPAYTQAPSIFILDDLFQTFSSSNYEYFSDINLKAYPNPFNPDNPRPSARGDNQGGTTIYFTAETTKDAEIIIYNIKGQKIKTFQIAQSEIHNPNYVVWDGNDNLGRKLSNGIYLFQLKIGNNIIDTKKCLLLK